MDKSDKKYFGSVVLFAALWIVSYTACLLIIKKTSPETPLGIVLSLIPVVTFALLIYSVSRGVAAMDEVQVRIQMEAVVIAFSLTLLSLMTLGLLDLVVTLKKEDWGYRQIFPFFAMFYFIGLLISKRKYGGE